MKWIDITRPVQAGMAVYSPEEGFSAAWQRRLPQGGYNLSRFCMGAHCGTHLDAPAHFLEGGATVERAPLDLLCGEALAVSAGDGFDPRGVPEGTLRLLLIGTFGGLDEAAADILIQRGVRLLGTSMLSICRPDREAEAHRSFLKGGVWLLENLRLEGVEPGAYRLWCLPLPLVGLEAAPARAVLRKLP